jgi:hypothetical protein
MCICKCHNRYIPFQTRLFANLGLESKSELVQRTERHLVQIPETNDEETADGSDPSVTVDFYSWMHGCKRRPCHVGSGQGTKHIPPWSSMFYVLVLVIRIVHTFTFFCSTANH